MSHRPKLTLGMLLKEHPRGPLAQFYIGGGKTRGDIVSPIIPYEDWTFDEYNICPEEYTKRVAASRKRD